MASEKLKSISHLVLLVLLLLFFAELCRQLNLRALQVVNQQFPVQNLSYLYSFNLLLHNYHLLVWGQLQGRDSHVVFSD